MIPHPRSLRSLLPARIRVRSAASLVVLGLLALPLVAWSNAVVVSVDGDEQGVRTYATTVGDVLTQLDVEVGPDDGVVPAEHVEIEDGLEISVDRAITVEIVLDGEPETLSAPVTSVAGALEEAGIGIVRRLDAEIVPAWTAPIHDGDTIVVNTPTAVTVEVDGEVREVETLVSTVEALLVRKDIELDDLDQITPDLDAPIEPGTEIVIERVDLDEVVEEIALEHGEQRIETNDLNRDTTRVRDEGADGLRHDTYRVTLVDGEEVERELVDQEVVEEPRDRVVLVGTYDPPPPPEPSTSSGDEVWDRLAQCESGQNWSHQGRYHGGLQFHPDTWRRNKPSGYPDYAYQATREQQIEVGKRVQSRAGWGAWPHCSQALGLR